MSDEAKPDWRSIPARVIDWRGQHQLYGRCVYALSLAVREKEPWHSLTLGQIADMGERQWRRVNGVGDKGVEAIKDVIDRAAEGKNITTDGKAPDAYIPKCERAE